MSASLIQKKPQFNTYVSSTPKTLHFDTSLSSTRPSVQHPLSFELMDVLNCRVFGVELTDFEAEKEWPFSVELMGVLNLGMC